VIEHLHRNLEALSSNPVPPKNKQKKKKRERFFSLSLFLSNLIIMYLCVFMCLEFTQFIVLVIISCFLMFFSAVCLLSFRDFSNICVRLFEVDLQPIHVLIWEILFPVFHCAQFPSLSSSSLTFSSSKCNFC
jgi:hypothetical protein